MDIDLWVWGALTVWVIGGLVGYYYMVRRAHPSPVWLLIGIGLGPFALLVFMERAEGEPPLVVGGGRSGPGRVEIIVGTDGSPQAGAAAEAAGRLFAGDEYCVVLCEVIDFDAQSDPTSSAALRARERLDGIAARLGAAHVDTEVVAGTPVEALMSAADQRAATAIVVGARGKGLSPRLLGSVSEGLVARSRCPVLVVGQNADVTAEPTRT
jgi:nucleotide-binding universal stress UspA family protein